jgi:hypothetical protein
MSLNDRIIKQYHFKHFTRTAFVTLPSPLKWIPTAN